MKCLRDIAMKHGMDETLTAATRAFITRGTQKHTFREKAAGRRVENQVDGYKYYYGHNAQRDDDLAIEAHWSHQGLLHESCTGDWHANQSQHYGENDCPSTILAHALGFLIVAPAIVFLGQKSENYTHNT